MTATSIAPYLEGLTAFPAEEVLLAAAPDPVAVGLAEVVARVVWLEPLDPLEDAPPVAAGADPLEVLAVAKTAPVAVDDAGAETEEDPDADADAVAEAESVALTEPEETWSPAVI